MFRVIRRAAKAAILVVAFVATPLLYGFVALGGAASAVYEPNPEPLDLGLVPPPPTHDPTRPTAVVVMSNQGSEVTDVLAPFEILARTGAFNVYAVAPELAPVPLGGGLEVLPQLTLEQLDARLAGTDPDLVVVPALNGVGSPAHASIRDWIREHAGGTTLLLAVCNGSQVLADAGLLDGRQATANWAALDAYTATYPAVSWVRGVRYVEADDLISTAGITSGVNGTLRAVARFIGDDAAADLAREIGYPDERIGESPIIDARRLEPGDAGIVVLEAAYDWTRPTIGVALAGGVGEIEVASIIDVHGGDAYAATTVTVAVDGSPVVRSAHGLAFVPRLDLTGEPGLDRLIVPGRLAAAAPDPAFEAWAAGHGLTPEYIHATPPGTAGAFPFDTPLLDLAARSSVAAASLTAKALEYPTDHLGFSGPAWPFAALPVPFLFGALGVAAVLVAGRLLGVAGRRLRGRQSASAPIAPLAASS